MATYRYRLRLSPLSAGRAPYGYRYVPRQDVVPGHLVVDEPEAELVRMLYGWLVDEQTTIRQILKRLNAGPWLPRSGRHAWSPSTVHHILADPIYVGTAYANRYAYVPGPSRGPNGARTRARRRAGASARASSGSPSRCRRWSTRACLQTAAPM